MPRPPRAAQQSLQGKNRASMAQYRAQPIYLSIVPKERVAYIVIFHCKDPKRSHHQAILHPDDVERAFDSGTQCLLPKRFGTLVQKQLLRSSRLPESVKKVTIFEDFNENFLELFALGRGLLSELNPERVRLPYPILGAVFAARSQQLEHLSVSFMIDARHFFDASQPNWRWPQLQTLSLTSRAIAKADDHQTNKLFQTAAQVALNMPKLQTLTMWQGERREACAFTYRRKYSSIHWQGTRDLKLESQTIKAWEKITVKYAERVLTVDKSLFMEDITSHGDAVHYLGLHHVVDSVSLQQIRAENRVSWL
ncbi:hypothetical protein NW765_016104 [Fusarium oxysporum]|nr:hypothetical protein NW765_016104 [Fusarium oxysporum]